MKVTSVRNRLLILFLPVFIMSFGVLSGISYYFSTQALTQSVNQTGAEGIKVGITVVNSAGDTFRGDCTEYFTAIRTN